MIGLVPFLPQKWLVWTTSEDKIQTETGKLISFFHRVTLLGTVGNSKVPLGVKNLQNISVGEGRRVKRLAII